jgi:hypothetical protein
MNDVEHIVEYYLTMSSQGIKMILLSRRAGKDMMKVFYVVD